GFELFANHPVHIHEHRKHSAHKTRLSGHGPGDCDAVRTGLQRKLALIRSLEWLHKIEPQDNAFVRSALGNHHLAFTNLGISGPGAAGTDPLTRPLKLMFCIRIEFLIGRPPGPGSEIIDQPKDHLGGSCNRRAALHAKITAPGSNDYEKYCDENGKSDGHEH